MTLNEWIDKQGRGELSRLNHESRVSLPTIRHARAGNPVTCEIAERLSKATGGKVSVKALRAGKRVQL